MSLATSAVAALLPVADIERAKGFYDRLDLPFLGTNDEGSAMFALDGGTTLVLLPRPDSRPSESTAMSFEVDDVSSEISALEARGVTFEDYDLPDFKTVDHIAEMGGDKAAWFLDPDGNVLCIHQAAAG